MKSNRTPTKVRVLLWALAVTSIGILAQGCSAPWPELLIAGTPANLPIGTPPATAHGQVKSVTQGDRLPANTPSVQATGWVNPPPCRNQPQGLAVWQGEFAERNQSPATARQIEAYLAQLRRHNSLFHDLSAEDLVHSLAMPDSAAAVDLQRQALTVLWLNVISGRLHRATGIEAMDAAGPDTVAELIDELERVETDTTRFGPLLSLADEVNAGLRIRLPVCAHLAYRTDTLMRETFWSAEGFFDKDRDLADVPHGITAFSPDHSCIVVECPRIDSAGGPLYLANLQTETLLNLNRHIGLPDYTGVSSLEVNAWHFDNRHLLLVNEDDEVFVWLDSATGEFTPLALGVDTSQKSPPREIALAPDGSGFTFITVNRTTGTTNLHWYDLVNQAPNLLTTLPVERGKVTDFAFSPTSTEATYVVRRGTHRKGYSDELHLINLGDLSIRVLLSDMRGIGGQFGRPRGIRSLLFTNPQARPSVASHLPSASRGMSGCFRFSPER